MGSHAGELSSEEEAVKVKCFECAALTEADDSDAVAHAFVVHGQERHIGQRSLSIGAYALSNNQRGNARR